MVLLTVDCGALFIWRKQLWRSDGQQGIECAVFRNEGSERSSSLILEAEALAWARWPDERLFTYVQPNAIRSSNPGYCFLQAGWQRLRQVSNRGARLLEKLP